MAGRPPCRPTPIGPSIDEDDKDEMDWVPEEDAKTTTAHASDQPHHPPFTQMIQPDSGYTVAQLRSHPSFPAALQHLSDLQVASFRDSLPRSPGKVSESYTYEKIDERSFSSKQDTIQDAEQDESRSCNNAQDTMAEEEFLHARTLGPEPAGEGCGERQSIRSFRPIHMFSSAMNTTRGGATMRGDAHRGNSVGGIISIMNEGIQPPRARRRIGQSGIAVPASASSSQQSQPNAHLAYEQTAQTLHSHLLPNQTASNESPQPFIAYTGDHLSDNDKEEDEELLDASLPRHKRRRADERARVVPSAETQRLEEQLMSNLVAMPGRARWTSDTLHIAFPRNCSSSRRRVNFDAAAMYQDILGPLPLLMPTQENPYAAYGEWIQQVACGRNVESPALPESYLPPPLPLKSKSLLYMSELLPHSFDQGKRFALLEIFRSRAPYIPSCINLATGLSRGIQYHVRNPPKITISPPRLPLGSYGQGWPSGSLPIEVFQIIVDYLPRDALQNLRLVNHEFERKVSTTLFHTVVVAFRPEIYGMLLQGSNQPHPHIVDIKGKGKEMPQPHKTAHDGMKTFQGWGPHIKKFAMAFEVGETILEKPPVKGKFETHSTFWGPYRWPHPRYPRFKFCEGLEKKADEFRCMSAALSNLTSVTELALSIDSGLGWLNGPDMSDRAQLFREKPRIFGKKQQILDAAAQERREIWDGIVKSTDASRVRPGLPNADNLYEATIEWHPNMKSQLAVRPTFDRQPSGAASQNAINQPLILGGVDVQQTALRSPEEERPKDRNTAGFSGAALIPNSLSPSQQEWLLETEWAQRAFISSFCMALSDNSQTFSRVTSLNIARLSSRYLPSLQREDIWQALPKLNALTIIVCADWRNILKSNTGAVDAPFIKPTTAASQFYTLLYNHIGGLENIKTLSVGFVGGGEHQTGIHGRNKFVLPAPIADFSDSALLNSVTNISKSLLVLRHVEHLDMTNCWFTPHMFKTFCTRMRLAKLQTLALKSVSLTSHPGDPPPLHKISTMPGTYLMPQGPPRRGYPSIGNFFDLRPNSAQEPLYNGWITTDRRIGSWGDVIDCVTPGANLDFVRYVYQYYDYDYYRSLKRFDPRNLERITFESCGYVNLTNYKEFHQQAVGLPEDIVPTCLAQRSSDLALVVMQSTDDKLLGQVIPSFPLGEEEILETGFPMQFGWTDQKKAAENLEDGQPLGGSGRFSGKVERLTFPELK